LRQPLNAKYRSAFRWSSTGSSRSASFGLKVAATAGLVGSAAGLLFVQRVQTEKESDVQRRAGRVVDGLPNYRLADVAKHGKDASRIWVTYMNAVYDVTDFVEGHPGGDRILLAAGGGVDKYWAMFAQHKTEEVFEILESLRIGNVHKDDRKPESSFHIDQFANEPSDRSPELKAHTKKPCNAEAPYSSLANDFYTPNEKFFVRNHLPVPAVTAEAWNLEIFGEGMDEPIRLSLDDLKTKFKPAEVSSALMCGGNRRAEMNKEDEVKGLKWGPGAISNAKWKGVYLRDVLEYAKVDRANGSVKHIQFEGLDRDMNGPYGASIPADYAFSADRDVLVAYEMNGKDLPVDHGYPARMVCPGVVGARSVKWLHKIIPSEDESHGFWQRNDYKFLRGGGARGGLSEFKDAVAIQELPVLSAIVSPQEGETVPRQNNNLTLKGYAWCGGGRGILSVDVSVDGGQNWAAASLKVPPELQGHIYTKNWHWTPWEATVQVPKGVSDLQCVCRAMDSSHNIQPEKMSSVWNVRGLLNTAWNRVQVKVN